MRSLMAVAGALSIVFIGSCENPPTAPAVQGVRITPDSLHLTPGQQVVIVATAVDGGGNSISGPSVSWASLDTTVATVSAAGTVTGRLAGLTTVTASADGYQAGIPVRVKANAKIILPSPADTALLPGQSFVLSVVVEDSTQKVLPGEPVTLTTADSTYLRVDSGHVVTAVRPGPAIVTITSGVAQGFTYVTVGDSNPLSIALFPQDTFIQGGGVAQMRWVERDAAHLNFVGPIISFTSDQTNFATATNAGLVTGVAPGKALISVFAGTLPGNVEGGAFVNVLDSSVSAATSIPGTPAGIGVTGGGIAYVLRASGNAISRIDLPAIGVSTSFGVGAGPLSVAFDSTGATAYVACRDAGMVQTVDVSSGTVTGSIGTTGNPQVVRMSPDNQSIWVTTDVDSIYQIDRATHSLLTVYALGGVGRAVAFGRNDSLAYVSSGSGVTEFNYKRSTSGRVFSLGGGTQGVVVSPDGGTLYVAVQGKAAVAAIDLGTGATVDSASFVGLGSPFDLQLSLDGTKLWVSMPDGGKTVELDRATLALLKTAVTLGSPRRIAVTAASAYVLVTNDSGYVSFIK